MRRPLIAGVALGVVLAVMPLSSRAATAASVTLITPSAGDLARGAVSIRWSYSGFHRSAPLDIEVKRGSGAFTRIARVVIDDGTVGTFGSATWATTSADDGDDYTVRIIVPTNKGVTSSASPVAVDNTGPTTTVTAEPVTDPAPPTAVLTDVEGTAIDAIAGVASVAVTFTDGDGNETEAEVTCDCGGQSATWSASTDGLLPGEYTVTAVGTDALGNVGAPSSAELVVVGTPGVTDPTPGLLATLTGITEPVVETVTGEAGDAVETVTGIVTDPPTADDTIATVTGTVNEVVGTVVGLTETDE